MFTAAYSYLAKLGTKMSGVDKWIDNTGVSKWNIIHRKVRKKTCRGTCDSHLLLSERSKSEKATCHLISTLTHSVKAELWRW